MRHFTLVLSLAAVAFVNAQWSTTGGYWSGGDNNEDTDVYARSTTGYYNGHTMDFTNNPNWGSPDYSTTGSWKQGGRGRGRTNGPRVGGGPNRGNGPRKGSRGNNGRGRPAKKQRGGKKSRRN